MSICFLYNFFSENLPKNFSLLHGFIYLISASCSKYYTVKIKLSILVTLNKNQQKQRRFFMLLKKSYFLVP